MNKFIKIMGSKIQSLKPSLLMLNIDNILYIEPYEIFCYNTSSIVTGSCIHMGNTPLITHIFTTISSTQIEEMIKDLQ